MGRPRPVPPAVRAALLAATLLAAACSTTPPSAPDAGAADAGTPVPASPSAAGGRLKPMPVRPLNVRADCRFEDEAGYAASARLDVDYAEVRDFAATVDIPRRGSCRFDFADFRQVKKAPHVELRAADGCTVHLWEQGEQVTVAFSQCASRCSRGTFDYVWPILVDRSSGRCS